MLRPGGLLALHRQGLLRPSFRLHGSPHRSVGYDYPGDQPIPGAGLSPARHAAVRGSINDEDVAAWQQLVDPAAWANEARPYLASHVYRLPRDRQLGAAYQRLALPVVKVQLQRAGVRLAAVLNEVLGVDGEGWGCGVDTGATEGE